MAEYLRDHPKVESVVYLGFLEEGSRQADIYKRHCTGAGSTFYVELPAALLDGPSELLLQSSRPRSR